MKRERDGLRISKCENIQTKLQVNKDNVGACMQHLPSCSGGTGMFLRLVEWGGGTIGGGEDAVEMVMVLTVELKGRTLKKQC